MKQTDKGAELLVAGGVAAGVMSSLCCIGPLLLTIFGISGAATISRLDVFRIPFIIIVVALFSIAGWLLYKKRNSCEAGSICSDPKTWKRMLWIYGFSLAVVIFLITSPYWIAWIWG